MRRTEISREDVHGHLLRCLYFLDDYDFEINYSIDVSNKTEDVLSRVTHGEPCHENEDSR